jgi:hypothetical protein
MGRNGSNCYEAAEPDPAAMKQQKGRWAAVQGEARASAEEKIGCKGTAFQGEPVIVCLKQRNVNPDNGLP